MLVSRGGGSSSRQMRIGRIDVVHGCEARAVEVELPGGNAGGAVLVGGTVRRKTGPWTPAVHDLLAYLAAQGFEGAPRPLGFDDQGREILTYLPGDTVGNSRPWPEWTRSDRALLEAGAWLRRYHDVVRNYRPPANAVWRLSTRTWQPGDVIAHNDAAPYNAVWAGHDDDGLVGFIDWDFAAPQPAIWDLAYLIFSWVPLHARRVVASEGFTDFASRPRRLRALLDAYEWTGTVDEALDAVATRVAAHIADVQEMATTDSLFRRLINEGTIDNLKLAMTEMAADRHGLIS